MKKSFVEFGSISWAVKCAERKTQKALLATPTSITASSKRLQAWARTNMERSYIIATSKEISDICKEVGVRFVFSENDNCRYIWCLAVGIMPYRPMSRLHEISFIAIR